MGNSVSKGIVPPVTYGRLIWLDANIGEKNDSYSLETITQLRRISPRVHPFNHARQCLEFIEKIENEKVCLVVSGSLGEVIISRVHDLEQIQAIVIFCVDRAKHDSWAKKWPKILGVFTDVDSICQMPATRPESCPSKNRLHRSFVYTEIFRDIFLSIDFKEEHRPGFCREMLVHDRTAIDWYTSESSLRSTLDRALKTMEIDSMIKLAFVIKDLHNQIQKQSEQQSMTEPLTVYYAENVSPSEFEGIRKNLQGLLSFNHFLLTTRNAEIARQLPTEKNAIRILFEMTIDPSKVPTAFAPLQDERILFSTHTVFRMGEVKSLDKTARFFQVKLTLTDARDKELALLATELREELSSQSNGWIRLACFLIKLAKFDQAQRIFEELLSPNVTTAEQGSIYIQLGNIQKSTGKYSDALELYRKGLAIQRKLLPSNHPDLARSYHSIGQIFDRLANPSMAHSCYERALHIGQQSFPSSEKARMSAERFEEEI